MKLRDRTFAPGKPDAFWRASRIAARILIKAESGRRLSVRDRRIGRYLAGDSGVEDRLIDQSLSWHQAPRRFRG